jgi:uncharacterized FlaG/YvyC family protein
MSTTPAIAPVTPDLTVGTSSYGRSDVLSPAALLQDQTANVDPSNLRLVIEDDQEAGTVVYKTVDWRTGVVVQQLPREQVLKLRETESYAAGAVVATKA